MSNLQAEFARILSAAQHGTPASAQSVLHGGDRPLATLPPSSSPPPTVAATQPPPTDSKYGWVKYVALGCLVAVVAVVVCACLRRSGQTNENISCAPPHWDKLRADNGGAEMYNMMLQQSAAQSPPAALEEERPQEQQPSSQPQQQPSVMILPAKQPPSAAVETPPPPPPPENSDKNFTTIQQLMAAQ